ncbi:uncharacterized [Tachysurus ichikawai]
MCRSTNLAWIGGQAGISLGIFSSLLALFPLKSLTSCGRVMFFSSAQEGQGDDRDERESRRRRMIYGVRSLRFSGVPAPISSSTIRSSVRQGELALKSPMSKKPNVN